MTTLKDMFLLDCNTYNDYLDTFITKRDVRYIRNLRVLRIFVILGYVSKDVYTPEEFETRKAAVQESLWPTKKAAIIFSERVTCDDPFLKELQSRELLNVQKIVATIIFLKYRKKSGFEVSGYIDFEDSLKRANAQDEQATDWLKVFRGKTMLRPKMTDLSYFDWHKNIVKYNDSDNFRILHDVNHGLIFIHKGDHKKICVDRRKKAFAANVQRSMIESDIYGDVVIYDHIIRKKN